MIDEDAHAVTAHFRLRPVRVAVVHEPHAVTLDGPDEAVRANPERGGTQSRDLGLAGVIVVVAVRGDDERITGTVRLDDTGVGGQLRVHHASTVAPTPWPRSHEPRYERRSDASASRWASSTTWAATASSEANSSTSSQCTRWSGRSHLTWRRAN